MDNEDNIRNDDVVIDGEYHNTVLFGKDRIIEANRDNMAISEEQEDKTVLRTENSYDEEDDREQ